MACAEAPLAMTLQPFDAARLDDWALRLLDLAATFRRLAQHVRDEELEGLPLHDRKSSEWLARLEQWAHDAQARCERERLTRQGARRAQEFLQKDQAKPR